MLCWLLPLGSHQLINFFKFVHHGLSVNLIDFVIELLQLVQNQLIDALILVERRLFLG